jgi:CHAT domain-containing protein
MLSQSKPPSRFAPLRWWRTVQAWRKTLAVENRLEAGKRALAETAAGAAPASTRPLRLLDLWRQSRTEAYVTFSALPDRLIAIVRTRRAARIHIIEISRIELRQAVKAWHERMLAPAVAAPRRSDALSNGLAGVLANLPNAVRELRLRPDDALHGYPFAALLVDGAPIIERYTISLWHTAASPRKVALSRTAVVLAATQPLGEYPALPQAAAEAAAISDMLSEFGFNVRTLINQAACKTEAAAALAHAAVVHMACHGRFQPDQPARTGLVLVSPGGSPETLSITDIGAIDCSQLQHVTLSACWSADNFVVPGRWIFSLPETLCRAGTGSVLGSLWEADDRLAGAFMRRFYTNLAQLPRAEALREVQVACLHNQLCPGLDTSDPISWANFYLFGDTGKLQCS